MPAFATLDRVSAATPDGRTLFDNLSLAFGPERVGVVGRNGAGKTTLLRLLAGEAAPAAGAVSVSGRVGVLRQALPLAPGDTVADALGVAEALARLRRIEHGRASEDDLAEADWLLPSRLETALAEVGLSVDLAREAATLSGGERTRIALAALLLDQPDLILLDEPTNNLDADAKAAVARLLDDWRKGAVVVSHDRALLRRVDRILDLSSLGPRLYGGGYDDYAERKAEEQAAAERELDAAERELRRVEREAQHAREKKARRDGAGKRWAARGTEPKILLGAQRQRAENSAGREAHLAVRLREQAAEGLEAARERVEQVRLLGFALPSTGLPAGRTVLAFEDAGWSADGRTVLRPLSFGLSGPDRVAVTGPNGAGKTTLLKLAAGRLEPTEGRVLRPVGAALLDQHAEALEPGVSLVENFRRLNPGGTDNQARAALARFLFRAEAGLRTPETLSGGERLRAALACVLGGERPPQLLMLDEPTNHLDLDSVQAIERALVGYDGALLIVSHDRDFLAAVGVEREIALSP